MPKEEKVMVLIKEITRKDRYDEDDFGREHHFLESETKISLSECKGMEEAKELVKHMGEANADDPPYEEYHFIIAWFKKSKKVVPKEWMLEG